MPNKINSITKKKRLDEEDTKMELRKIVKSFSSCCCCTLFVELKFQSDYITSSKADTATKFVWHDEVSVAKNEGKRERKRDKFVVARQESFQMRKNSKEVNESGFIEENKKQNKMKNTQKQQNGWENLSRIREELNIRRGKSENREIES